MRLTFLDWSPANRSLHRIRLAAWLAAILSPVVLIARPLTTAHACSTLTTTGEYVLQRDGALSIVSRDARGVVWLRAWHPLGGGRVEVARIDMPMYGIPRLTFAAIPEPGIDRALVTTASEILDLRPGGGTALELGGGWYRLRAAALGPRAEAFVVIADGANQQGHLYFSPAQVAEGGWKEIAILSDAACLTSLRASVVELGGSFVALCSARPVELVGGMLVPGEPAVQANLVAASAVRDPGGGARFFALAAEGQDTELLQIAHEGDGSWSAEALLTIGAPSGESPRISAIDASRAVIQLGSETYHVWAPGDGGPWMQEHLSLPRVEAAGGGPVSVTSASGDPLYLLATFASGRYALYWREDDGSFAVQLVGQALYGNPDACPPPGCLCTATVPSRGGQAPGALLIVLFGGVVLRVIRRRRRGRQERSGKADFMGPA